jgi:hypothetical protein
MSEQYRVRRNAFAVLTIVWLLIGVCIVTSAYWLVFYDTNRIEEGCDDSLTDVACNEDAAENIGSTTVVLGLFVLLVYVPFLFAFAYQAWRFHQMWTSV